MLEQSYYDEADKIIAAYGTEPRFLIPIIQDIQSEYKYLPPELLRYVADKLNIAEAKAYSVATFYENFSFDAKGKFILKVCDGTACHVRKSMDILNQLYKELGLSKEKHTTDDMMFTLETVICKEMKKCLKRLKNSCTDDGDNGAFYIIRDDCVCAGE